MTNYSTTSITELAAIVASHLRDQDIQVVLVGGLAVELYSENIYLTKDIGLDSTATPPKPPSTPSFQAMGGCSHRRQCLPPRPKAAGGNPELRFREAGAQWVWGTANCMAATPPLWIPPEASRPAEGGTAGFGENDG